MKQYENHLEKCYALERGGRETLYDRVKLLIKVADDEEFKQSVQDATQVLNERVSDTCATFAELYQMMKLFPKKEQWKNGNIAAMRREMLATLSANQRRSTAERRERTVLSWKEKYLELESKYKQLEAAYKQLEKDYKEIQRHLQRKSA